MKPKNIFEKTRIKVKFFLIFLLLSLVSGCANKSPYLQVNIQSANFINPNIYQQASPVVITLYQLKEQTNFTQMNFFVLSTHTQNGLGGDLMDKQEIEIQPGQQIEQRINVMSGANYVGVIAAFRNPDVMNWRAIKKITYGKNVKLRIAITAQGITLE